MIIGNSISPGSGFFLGGGGGGLPSAISFWTADNTPDDFYGNNDGTLINGATYNGGLINQAFSLDGINDYVNCGLATLQLASFTVSCFVKPNSIQAGNATLVSNGTGSTGAGWQLVLGNGFPKANQDSSNVTSADIVNTTEWWHILYTYDGSEANIYVNGVLKSTLGGKDALIYDNGDQFEIGSRGAGSNPYDGLIDCIGIWGSVLDFDQIQLLYNNGAGLQAPF